MRHMIISTATSHQPCPDKGVTLYDFETRVSGPYDELAYAQQRLGEVRDLVENPDDYRIVSGERDESGWFVEVNDPHLVTAGQVFGTDASTPEQRRVARAINFGFLYGKRN